MPAGLQVFNADGSLQIDIDSRLLRTLTHVSTGTTDGSATVIGAAQGSVVGIAVDSPESGVTPTVTNSGTTVSWSFGSAPSGDRRAVTLDIVVY